MRFDTQGVNLNPLKMQLNNALTTWDTVTKEIPAVQTKITPMIKSYATRVKGDIQAYEQAVRTLQLALMRQLLLLCSCAT